MARRKLIKGGAIGFGLSERCALEQLGRRVLHVVGGFIVGCVRETEIGGKVDARHARLDETRRMEHAGFVGYAHEDDVARKQRIGCVRFEHQVVVNAVKRGIHVGDVLSGFGIGSDDSNFELGMAGANSQHFGSGVTRGPHDSCFNHVLLLCLKCIKNRFRAY